MNLDVLHAPLPASRQGEVLATTGSVAHAGPFFYIESYGCAMNFSDSEIVASILGEVGYAPTRDLDRADLIFINTCSIREKAEETVRKRLRIFDKAKARRPGLLVGVLGCMAERLKAKFLEEERLVDMVVGPDAYRDLPKLVAAADGGERGLNVHLSREETYADIAPVRLDSNGVTAYISIMRGCDNMCSFCVVPFTRGRERSRDLYSVLAEAEALFAQGFREVTLLGQNVDSYKWTNPENGDLVDFAALLEAVAGVDPALRIRFSTSHPKDITDEVLHTMARHRNICKYIHLPAQSGNSRVLELMNRTYDREWYLERVAAIRRIVPECAISSDMIAGFCTETEAEHAETISLMEIARYSMSYMFYYSERPGTLAARKYPDDIPLEVKKRRLQEIIDVQQRISAEDNAADEGKVFEVLIECDSKRSAGDWLGKNSQNKKVVWPKRAGEQRGDYVRVLITDSTSQTLFGHGV